MVVHCTDSLCFIPPRDHFNWPLKWIWVRSRTHLWSLEVVNQIWISGCKFEFVRRSSIGKENTMQTSLSIHIFQTKTTCLPKTSVNWSPHLAFQYYMTPLVGVGGIWSVVGREWESFMTCNGSLKPGQRCNKCSSQFCLDIWLPDPGEARDCSTKASVK